MKRSALAFAAVLFAAFSANASNSITPEAPEKLNGCYQISNAEELYGFAAIVNGTHNFTKDKSACGKLTEDIVVNNRVLKNLWDEDPDFAPWNPLDTFAGTFDGNGHTISGLYLDLSKVTDAPNIGFIRVLVANPDPENPTVIKNLGIVDSYFSVKAHTGSLASIFVVEVIDSDSDDDKDSYAQIINCYNQSVADYDGYGEISYLVEDVGDHVVLSIENSYNAEDGHLYSSNSGAVNVKNSYQVDYKQSMDAKGVMHVTEAQFENGTVAFALHEASRIWGQYAYYDDYPNFSGVVENSTAGRYNVTFHTYEGDEATYLNSYISGFFYDLPDTVIRENTAFLGWFQDKEFSGKRDTAISTSMSGDLEYWANLKDIYTITFHLNGGSFDAAWSANYGYCSYRYDNDFAVCKYLEGLRRSLPTDGINDINRAGYFLVGWYDNEALEGERITAMTAKDVGDKDFYAKWFELKTPAIDANDSCYEISDVAELYGFARIVNRDHYYSETISQSHLCGKLTKDIVVNANVLKRDGTLDESRVNEFMPWSRIYGSLALFDGQGYKISGLYVTEGAGLFTGLSPSDREKETVIRNLTIDDSYSEGSGIVGYAELPLTLENCHFKGYIDGATAGLVAIADTTLIIKNSSHQGKMSGKGSGYMGGLVGTSYTNLVLMQNFHEGSMELVPDTVISESNGTTYVNEYSISAGTLVGHLLGSAYIANNYSVSDIEGTGSGMVGGLIGSAASVTMLVSRKDAVHYRPMESFIVNNYNKGSFSERYKYYLGSDKWIIDNTYYLSSARIEDDRVQAVEESAFEDGTLAAALHDYVQKDSLGNVVAGGINGDVWKQGDYYPVFGQKEERNVAVLHMDTTGLCKYIFYTPGETVALPVLEQEGYRFYGWYRNPKFTGEPVEEIASTDSGNLDFYPEWGRIYVRVVVEMNDRYWGEVRINNSWSYEYGRVSERIEYGKTVYVEAIPDNGYRFVQWDTICGTKSYCSFVVKEDVNLVATFEKLPPSSSSVASSSSMEFSSSVSSSSVEPPKSSSSSAKSSSSVSSSSSAKSSSSDVKSSSSSEGKSSSSGGKDALPAYAMVQQFSVSVMNRNLQVAGARVGDRYVLFDMQGNVVLRGAVNSANFNVAVPVPGNYVLRIGYGTRKVAVGY
jgi:uncharacterized repeat protein (TIGR02543 family)